LRGRVARDGLIEKTVGHHRICIFSAGGEFLPEVLAKGLAINAKVPGDQLVPRTAGG
jgi:hypothetical protein